jgi:hypothetical protein
MAGRYNKNAGLSLPSRMIAKAAWYRAEDLMDAITDIRGQNLGVQSNRDQALQKISNLRSKVIPFGHELRFPANEVWICEAYGDWSKKLQQLRAALMYKDDRNIGANRGETGTPTAPNNGTTRPANGATSSEQQSNDAFNAAINATTTIMDAILNMQGIIDQYTFETRFLNKWHLRNGNVFTDPAETPTAMVGDSSLNPAT